MLTRYRRRVVVVLTVPAVAMALAAPLEAAPPASSSDSVRASSPLSGGSQGRERAGYYDARQVVAAGSVASDAKALPGRAHADVKALRRSIGPSAIVSIDPLTGTPSNVGSFDGFLTGRSAKPARSVAMGYVRANASALGLTAADLTTFRLRKDYVDIIGTHHLSWTQNVRGIQVFGNGLRAHVTKDGRLVAIQGSPVSGLRRLVGAAPSSADLSAASARETAAEDVGGSAASVAVRSTSRSSGTTIWSNEDRAQRVWFVSAGGARLAWSTYTQAGDTLSYSHVIDARSGNVLYRSDLVDHERGDALVRDYYPGARRGGKARVVNFFDRGWVGRRADWLSGPNVSAWADVNDDNAPNANETTPVPGRPRRAQFPLTRFNDVDRLCSPRYICTWDPATPFSWRANKKTDVTNAFYLGNRFHDWLQNSSVGFTPAAGNFERADGDPLLLNAMDGANTDSGLPDLGHIDNANMSTPPDGIPPTMQMYLFRRAPEFGLRWLATSSSFAADILYHEYTHGLSNRLVTDATGNGALNAIQAGSMGEAWSDYFALDFLVKKGFQPDSPDKDGQVLVGKYTGHNRAGLDQVRTQALDCPLDATHRLCIDVFGVPGGYTYGDFPTVAGAPEVHASGEIWAQTLWEIREVLGSSKANMLIARGMELSVDEPSFLDMRNAILQADKIAFGSDNTTKLWRVFANRGMGWFAAAVDGTDAFPVENFRRPPSPTVARGAIVGVVTDPVVGEPVEGATVTVAGHPEYSDTTNTDGEYGIGGIRPGTYPKVVATSVGYEIVDTSADVEGGAATSIDFEIRRNWATSDAGGEVVDFNGPDFTPDCGPGFAIDNAQGTGWGSTTGDDIGTPTNTPIPKFVEISLPAPVDIAAGTDAEAGTAFRVDPSNTCGDAGSASTNEYRIEVSTDGTTWTEVVDDAFGTIDDPDTRGHYFDVASTLSVPDVEFVRFWMDSPQVPDIATNCPDGAFDGCVFMDMTEIQVFGTPAA